MKNIAPKLCVVLLAAAALPLALAGCAVQPGDPLPGGSEAVGTATEAWDSTCINQTPDATLANSGSYTSPSTYSDTNCFKGKVVAINNLQIGSSGDVSVDWADTTPSMADCANSIVGVYRWHFDPGTLMYVADTGFFPKESHGVWQSGSLNFCELPEIDMTVAGGDITNGHNYLFALTARTASGATAAFTLDAHS